MLPKSRRLKTGDFKSLHKARTAHAPHLFIHVAEAAGAGKAAVVVSSAVCKRAVDRNLLRRRLYHLLRKHDRLVHGKTVVVTLKKGAAAATFQDLEAELVPLLWSRCL